LKALEKQPGDRYSQMPDMVEDMETLMARVLNTKPTGASPADEATSQATVVIDSIQSFLRGPHFTVAGSGVAVPIPPQDEVLIGRADPTSGMLVDVDLSRHGASGAGVSRQHAKLVCQDDQWTVEDLRSINGTYINKNPVSPFQPVSLKDGDRVDLGQLILVFHIGGEAK
jgi:pSer/pThr/pTyr-binding forkhead associated (FHA) protein